MKLFMPIFTQSQSRYNQHLYQQNTSEQIKQVRLIFEGAKIQQKLIITQLNNSYKLRYKCNKFECHLVLFIFKTIAQLENRPRELFSETSPEQTSARKRERVNKIQATLKCRHKCELWTDREKRIKSLWYNSCLGTCNELTVLPNSEMRQTLTITMPIC